MLLDAITQKLDIIVEFSAFEDFISFKRKNKNKTKRMENNKIRAMIEVDMVHEIVKFYKMIRDKTEIGSVWKSTFFFWDFMIIYV